MSGGRLRANDLGRSSELLAANARNGQEVYGSLQTQGPGFLEPERLATWPSAQLGFTPCTSVRLAGLRNFFDRGRATVLLIRRDIPGSVSETKLPFASFTNALAARITSVLFSLAARSVFVRPVGPGQALGRGQQGQDARATAPDALPSFLGAGGFRACGASGCANVRDYRTASRMPFGDFVF